MLGTHNTAQEAYKQEYAIQKSQENKPKAVVIKGAALTELTKKASDTEFEPDLAPEDMRESYNSIYGHVGPRLASMKEWPEHWLDDQDGMGWLQWYEQYSAGRRTENDDRQIKRWKSFKARHGSQLKANPTPRRAYAVRNWARLN